MQAATTTPTTDKTKDGLVASMNPTPNIAYPQTTQITLTVYKYAAPKLAITSGALPAGKVATAYTTALQATGGTTPYSWALTDGALPPGLTLGPDGTITGTPTGPPGEYTFTVRATDSTNPVMQASKKLKIIITV